MSNILTSLVSSSTARFGADRIAFSFIKDADAEIVPYTWADVAAVSQRVAGALIDAGVRPGDSVAVFAPNMAEVVLTDLAAYAVRAVPVSIYSTSSPSQVAYILNDCKAAVVFVGSQKQYDVVREVVADCPCLKKIVTMDPSVEHDPHDALVCRFSGIATGPAPSADVLTDIEIRTSQATPDDVATLLYTSGTTGEPKGTILPHSCFNAQLEAHLRRLVSLSQADTSLCFLPLSHIFEKAWCYFCLMKGMHVTINYDPRQIARVLRRVRPTCMCSVPRFWEKAYVAVHERLDSASALKRRLLSAAIQVGMRRNIDHVRCGLKVPRLLAARYAFYDRVVLAPLRKAIGVDRANILPVAGAPLSDEIVEFFRAAGVPLVIGYGLSETTATVSCYPYVDYKIGTVGTPVDCVEVKTGENSEIFVKGPTVMRGYFNKPEATAEAFTADGWFRTGDAGTIAPDGTITLTERIKDLFKTSNGKYIAPQALESRLAADPFIEQVAVIGDNRKYVTAIVVPAFAALKKYARKHRIAYTNLDELINKSEIKQMLRRRIEKLQAGMASFEQIKKFDLLPAEFTIESGELTNTLKLCRPVIARHYADRIDAMYQS